MGGGQLEFQADDAYRGVHPDAFVDQLPDPVGTLQVLAAVAAVPTVGAVRLEQAGRLGRTQERRGALATNPVRDTGRLRKPRRTVIALTSDHLEAVRAAIRQWQQPIPGRPGPRHTGDLADIVDLMLATGARIGEILALQWVDLDLAAERPTLTICGTLVYVKGKGFFRQEWTKTDAGYRMLVLPRFAVGMLLARKLTAAESDTDAILGSRRGTWMSPNNVRRQWRQARADIELEWVTPHTFRKTVATLIDKEANTKSAAAQLGHANENITNTYYIAKPALAPDVSDILEQLGTSRTATGPGLSDQGSSRSA